LVKKFAQQTSHHLFCKAKL